MTKNESTVDRAIRAGISVTALGAGLSLGGIFTPPGAALLGVSVVSGVTSARRCVPLYTLLDLSAARTIERGPRP